MLEEAAASVGADQRRVQNQLGWSNKSGNETLECSTGKSSSPEMYDSGISSSASPVDFDLVKPKTLCDIADKLCSLKHQQNMSVLPTAMGIPFLQQENTYVLPPVITDLEMSVLRQCPPPSGSMVSYETLQRCGQVSVKSNGE